jgi:hypothetical protein
MLRVTEQQQSWRLTMMSKRRPIIESGQEWHPRKVELGMFRSMKLRKKRLTAIGAKRWRAAFPSKLDMTWRPKILAKATMPSIPPEEAVNRWRAAKLIQTKPRTMKTADELAGSQVYAKEISDGTTTLAAIECGEERPPARLRKKLPKAELRAIEPEN